MPTTTASPIGSNDTIINFRLTVSTLDPPGTAVPLPIEL